MTELKKIETLVIGAGPSGTVHIQEVMAEFQCHKIVKAAVIKNVTGIYQKGADLALVIGLPGTDIEIPYLAIADMVSRFEPSVGDYVVLYENDYVAISPKQPFDDGYAQLNFVDIGDEEETFVPENAVDQITNLARYAHNLLMQYAKAYDQELNEWDCLEKKEQQHLISRIAHFMTYPDAEASAPHEAWRLRLTLNGWSMGDTFDPVRKTRSDLRYFSQLPPEQQATDFIVKGIVSEAFHRN